MTHLALLSLWHQLTGPLYPVLDWPVNTGPNGGYNFWSGIGLGPAIGLCVWYRTIMCHAPWCLRIGHHQTADGHYKLCRHHHPDLAAKRPSLQEIERQHYAAKSAVD